MDNQLIPKDPEAFADLFKSLKEARYEKKAALKASARKRQSLSKAERDEVFSKTAGRCHVCGGRIEAGEPWEADHVFAHASGGTHESDTPQDHRVRRDVVTLVSFRACYSFV